MKIYFQLSILFTLLPIDIVPLIRGKMIAMEKKLESIEKVVLYVFVFLIPLAFITSFSDIFTFPKLLVLGIGVGTLLVIKSIRILALKKITLFSGSFDVPLLIITAAYLLSFFFTKANLTETFILPGAASVVVGAFILYFFANSLNLSQRQVLKLSLFGSGVILSVVSLFSFSGLLAKIPQLAGALDNSGKLYILGGDLPMIFYTATVLPLGISLALSTKDSAKKFFYSASLLLVILGLSISIAGAISTKNPVKLADFQSSWEVAVDSVKENPLFGVGPGNYLSAFNRFRPLSYNSKDVWQLRFTTGRDYFLTLVTETGIIGAIGLILLVGSIIASSNKIKFDYSLIKDGSFLSLIIILMLLALFPATITSVVLLFLILSLNATTKVYEISLSHKPRFHTYLIAVPVLALACALFYFGTRVALAENSFKLALTALSTGDGKKTYDLMRKTLRLNPYSDKYHALYAQTNVAIAQSLAKQKTISDDDKKTISVLIQQAIREGKNTVFLSPTRSDNWELLARIYQAIIPYAQGADQFAIQAYSQAIALDPINPNLRIALGGIYYSLEKYDDAIDILKLAVAAKPDLANAHYNLSAAYREKKDYEKAVAEMEIVLNLVAKDSPDYQQAQKELEALKAKAPAKKETTTESLTAPTKAQEPVITPQLELPSEATPPATYP